MNFMTMQGGLALGSGVWGSVATAADTRVALAIAAAVLALMIVATRRVQVTMGEEAAVTTGVKLSDLVVAAEPQPDDGPILIQIEYHIAAENRSHFMRAIYLLEPVRRRNGASSWRVYRDLGEDGRFVERFLIESWAEYTRLRGRLTLTDQQFDADVKRLQQPDTPIRVSRLIATEPLDAEQEEIGAAS